MTPLEGKRLRLRLLEPQDVGEAYVRWMNDPEVTRFLEVRFRPQTLESIKDFVTSLQGDRNNLLFGMFLADSGRHIGNIKLGGIDRNHGTADIGLFIGEKDCWNRGFATEAIALVTEYAFGVLGLYKVVAGFYAANEGSIRALHKAGYFDDGRLKDQLAYEGGRADQVLVAIINPGVTS